MNIPLPCVSLVPLRAFIAALGVALSVIRDHCSAGLTSQSLAAMAGGPDALILGLHGHDYVRSRIRTIRIG